MLCEVRAAKPFDGKLKQRWFTDEDFDLTVWYAPTGELYGFQLCYGKRGSDIETALTWRNDAGIELSAVDNGGRATPILRPGGRAPDVALLERFRRHAKNLEPQLKRVMVGQLRVHLRSDKLRPQEKKTHASR